MLRLRSFRDSESGTDPRIRWVRVALFVTAGVGLYLLGRWLAHDVVRHFSLLVRPHNEPLLHRTIMTATVVYIALMATPFMPAAEIGFSLLVIFGGKIAFLVYVSTVVALSIGYWLGRFLPTGLAVGLLGMLGLTRARRFVQQLAPLSGEQRLAFLDRQMSVRLSRRAVRHRFMVLAVLLNIPGNIVIGGGGGIALVAGMTRLFPFPAYLATVALAVAPLPLLVFLVD